jgi:ACR3 family arsenite efflux pump ArsB
MMYPILCKIKYETLHLVFMHRQIWIQIGFSIILNWIVAPLFMVSHESMMVSQLLCMHAIIIVNFTTKM